jgi:hypothetical protein
MDRELSPPPRYRDNHSLPAHHGLRDGLAYLAGLSIGRVAKTDYPYLNSQLSRHIMTEYIADLPVVWQIARFQCLAYNACVI